MKTRVSDHMVDVNNCVFLVLVLVDTAAVSAGSSEERLGQSPHGAVPMPG